MAAMILHQSYMIQNHSLFTLIIYYATIFSFTPMFTDGWFAKCAMAFCIASAY